MQAVIPEQANTVYLTILAVADNTPITSGTVNFYLYCTDGDNEGKYWNYATAAWESSKASAGVASHLDDGLWYLAIAAGAWPDYESRWRLYAEEDGDLHIPVSDQVVPTATGSIAGTTYAGGVTEIANVALSIVGRVAHMTKQYITNINDTDDDDVARIARTWGFARDWAMTRLDWPELVRYVDPGTELTSSSYNTFPSNEDGDLEVYTVPTNCLAIRGVVDRDLDSQGNEVNYWYTVVGNQIAMAEDGDEVYIKYILRYTDTTKWSLSLKNVAAHRWAYLMARPMGADEDARAQLLRELQVALQEARSEIGLTAWREPSPIESAIEIDRDVRKTTFNLNS